MKNNKSLSVLFILIVITISASAQDIRTAYFMKHSSVRTTLNPAFRPERGYVLIPAIGGLNASYTSNGVALSDILYPKNGNLVTFLDPSVNTESFLKGLNKQNQWNVSVSLPVLSAGWYSGKGFWTASISLKTLSNINVPKSMFEFMKRGTGENGASYDISNLNAYVEGYVETAAGYLRPINEKLTVGGKLKVLLGVGSMDTQIDRMHVEMNDEMWRVTSSGSMNVSMKGLSAEHKIDEAGREYINDFDFDTPGISGFGLGVDLGATYKLMDNLTLSAAILDLGFINWGKSGNISGEVTGDPFEFTGFDIVVNNQNASTNISDQFDSIKDDFEDLFHFSEKEASKRTTRLRSTINLGAEYSILNDQLGFGLLSSTRLYSPKAYTELTASVNYRPLSWFEATLSYSFIHSKFKTYGFALNFTPSWINFFIGSDYMFTKVTPQFMPVNSNAVNLYMGIGIPLGRRHAN